MSLELSINEQIALLPLEAKDQFESEVKNCLEDENWCDMYKVDYGHPDERKVERILLGQRYNGKFVPVMLIPTSE